MAELIALFSEPAAWAALITLIAMEVVLGIDNLIFISILTNKLPEEMRPQARKVGIGMALGLRLALLSGVAFIVTLTEPVLHLFDKGFSWRDLILIAGGLFLVWKATKEIHHKLEGDEGQTSAKVAPTLAAVIGQVLLLDLVFSIDSVITAVGMTTYVPVMVISIVTAVIVMLLASKAIYTFVNAHPSVKMLALAFLLLIGTTLIAEGFGQKIPKGYIYAAMAFSVFVEVLNIGVSRRKKHAPPVHLREPIIADSQ